MKKKLSSLLLFTSSLFLLVACNNSDDLITYSDGQNTAEQSGQVEPIIESEENDSVQLSEDTSSSESSTTGQTEETEEFTAEEQSIISHDVPEGGATAQTAESSAVEQTESAVSTTEEKSFDNSRASELMNIAIPLIHEASGNMFKTEGYVFTPILLNDNLVQVEVRKQSPDSQNHDNLITIYRYDNIHGHLMEQNVVNADWSNVTPQ